MQIKPATPGGPCDGTLPFLLTTSRYDCNPTVPLAAAKLYLPAGNDNTLHS
jgi:hypothetical protein